MNDKHFKWLLYLIVFVILSTIAIQVFWNYKNYQTNKQQVYNDIQLSLDDAVEAYYTDLSKRNFLTIIRSDDGQHETRFSPRSWDSIIKPLRGSIKRDSTRPSFSSITLQTDSTSNLDSLKVQVISSVLGKVEREYMDVSDSIKKSGIKGFTQLSEDRLSGITFDKDSNSITRERVFWGEKARDSLRLLKGLSTVFIAMQQDSLDYKKLDSIVVLEMDKKGIYSGFYVNHFKNRKLKFSSRKNTQPKYTLEKRAKSTFAKPNETITLSFENPVSETFKRSSIGILLSTLLILAVVSCLFYLLKIISRQKQLSQVKNDLISNITHEFKTPIATIGVALESIKNFNGIEDKEKTKNYLNMSSEQLTKLNIMVEKLLETATLDSEKLTLNKEELNLVELITGITDEHQVLLKDKVLNFENSHDIIPAKIDLFHFENALNNIIDNAIKYGGDIINISLKKTPKLTTILVSDNGTTLSKAHKDKIFEQFYRVPKGNTHDVKGFGIGLYYAKTIIEKHKGTLSLDLSKSQTTFKITLPNE